MAEQSQNVLSRLVSADEYEALLALVELRRDRVFGRGAAVTSGAAERVEKKGREDVDGGVVGALLYAVESVDDEDEEDGEDGHIDDYSFDEDEAEDDEDFDEDADQQDEEEEDDDDDDDDFNAPYASPPPTNQRKRATRGKAISSTKDSANTKAKPKPRPRRRPDCTTEKSHVCDWTSCPKTFATKGGLTKHVNSEHTHKNQHRCPVPSCTVPPASARETVVRHLLNLHKIPLPTTEKGMKLVEKKEVRRKQARVFAEWVGNGDDQVGREFFLRGIGEG
ncbi:uncharacterized protein LTR77_002926 [Saxophila tyrrhenica]|uniref:C2H2-type domain-containing protein n=1 Tax=Saxophila tyrrhenica TaxID=1690608 RepID=A0AAV9PG05_9PEZI|nr:hypothetical protein LTR77_002926 [Saxophila tyrrhenica]